MAVTGSTSAVSSEMRPHGRYLLSACVVTGVIMLLVGMQLLVSTSRVRVSLLADRSTAKHKTGCVQGRDGANCNQKVMSQLRRRNSQRRDHVTSVCANHSANQSKPNPYHIYVDDRNRILYCAIPKVACTNWKRVLLVLSGKTNYSDPLEIPASWAHSSDMEKLVPTLDAYTPQEIKHKLNNYFKFMIVRDPLERLLSAYRNKFTKSYNTYFHRRIGRQIVKRFRKKPSKKSLNLGNDVTFEEFLQYVVNPATEQPLNEHWRAMHELCFPCEYQYDVIGRYETMHEDVQFILQEAGVSHLVTFPQSYYNSTQKTSDFMRDAYRHIPSEMIHRLWEQYSRDYTMFDYPYPESIGAR